MSFAPPQGAFELMHNFYPEFKNEILYALCASQETISGTVCQGTLFTHNTMKKIPCAIKLVSKTKADGKAILNFFSGNNAYPDYLVKIYGIREETIVMEPMAGSLFDVLYHDSFAAVRKNWTQQTREDLAAKCLMQLLEWHKLGIVHCDISPATIWVNSDATRLLFCDFGSISNVPVETTMQSSGTVPYMAPERITNATNFTQQQWMASDMYSVGLIMIEIVSGKRPFHMFVDYELLYNKRLKNKPCPPFEQLIENELCVTVQKLLLAFEPTKRDAALFVSIMEHVHFCAAIKCIYVKERADLGENLLIESAAQANVFACQLLVHLYKNGLYVEKNLTASENYSKARESCTADSRLFTYLSHYASTSEDVHLTLALACFYGWGCVKDVARYYSICKLYPQSVIAQNRLGDCYMNGEGVSQDHLQAVHWYQLAASQGNADTQFNLGICYYNGYGVVQDYAQAVHWCMLASNQEDAHAQNYLGYCYELGQGTTKNIAKAIDLYILAANQGNSDAQYNLGQKYQFGIGVSKDLSKAKELYNMAAAQGHERAMAKLNKKV